MSRIGHRCHSGVSQTEFTPRIEMVRRSLIVSSALVAALSVAWSATPVFRRAHSPLVHVTAPSQHCGHTAHRTCARRLAAVTAGTAPTQLQSQSGASEQAAIGAAGSGNPQVTTPADPSIAVGRELRRRGSEQRARDHTAHRGISAVSMNISAMIDNTSGFDRPVPARGVRPGVRAVHPDGAAVQQDALGVRQPGGGDGVAVQPSAALDDSRGTINIDPELGGGVELSNVSLGITGSVVVEFERLRELHHRVRGCESDGRSSVAPI